MRLARDGASPAVTFHLTNPDRVCYNTGESKKAAKMAQDPNHRSVQKPRGAVQIHLDFLEARVRVLEEFTTALASALVVGDENMRRVKVLAAVAAWSSHDGR